MAKGQNLIKLAKGGEKKEKTTTKKPVEKKVVLTPAEERDLKAKQKVEELLHDVEFIPKKDNEELLEIDGDTNKNIEWFEEQLKALSSENAVLKSELEVAKGDYTKLFGEFQKTKQGRDVVLTNPNPEAEEALRATVVKLFNEIQANYLALGKNFVIVPPAFLNRLIMFFPFLQNEKRF